MSKNRGLNAISVLFLIYTLSGCMMTASAKNDFSEMGNDVFSNLVKGSIMENFGPHGYEGIRQAYIREESEKYFLGKNEKEVLSIFDKNKGNCVSLNLDAQQDVGTALVCETSRKWKLVNSGYPSFGIWNETLTSSEPGAKLIFKFHLSHEKYVSSVVTEIQDITTFRRIY